MLLAEASSNDALLIAGMGSITTIVVALIGAGLLKHKGFFKSLASIERGVNHVGPDEPPLIEQVRMIARGLDETRGILIEQNAWVAAGMTEIARQTGTRLPPAPTAHYADSHEDKSQRQENQ